MPRSHAVVWMDFKEAHVYLFGSDDVERRRLKANNPFRKVHHKAGAIGGGKSEHDSAFFSHIGGALTGVREWLLVGPGQSKTDFLRYVETHDPSLKARLAAVQPMDHPTDGELLEHVRCFFKAFDRLRPNAPPPPGNRAA